MGLLVATRKMLFSELLFHFPKQKKIENTKLSPCIRNLSLEKNECENNLKGNLVFYHFFALEIKKVLRK